MLTLLAVFETPTAGAGGGFLCCIIAFTCNVLSQKIVVLHSCFLSFFLSFFHGITLKLWNSRLLILKCR